MFNACTRWLSSYCIVVWGWGTSCCSSKPTASSPNWSASVHWARTSTARMTNLEQEWVQFCHSIGISYRLSNSNNMLTILKSTALPYIITYKNYCTYFWQWFQYNIPFLIVWYWSAHLSLREVRLYISSQFLRKTHRICRHLLLLAQSLKHCLRRLYGCFDENWRRICFGNLIRTLYCSLLGLLRPVVLEVITQAIFKISNVILWRVVIASGV